jgi:hypothetical protein
MFGGITVSGNWIKQLFGYLDILQFVRMSRHNLTGHVNRINITGKELQAFNNNPQGNRLRGPPKHGWWNCVQTYINRCKIKNWKKKLKHSRMEMSIKEANVCTGL